MTEDPKKHIHDFIAGGLDLEGMVVHRGQDIREHSKREYEQGWLDARMNLFAVLNHVLASKSGVPGETSREISEILVLVSAFTQGLSLTESAISEGQYVKAAAALKQDLEILTRIKEVRAGKAIPRKVPNVKYAPKGSQRFYGELNDVAHPSNVQLLSALLSTLERGEVTGVSPVPEFKRDVARGFYELHIWFLFEVAREAVALAFEMYGEDADMGNAVRGLFAASECMTQAGFTMTEG